MFLKRTNHNAKTKLIRKMCPHQMFYSLYKTKHAKEKEGEIIITITTMESRREKKSLRIFRHPSNCRNVINRSGRGQLMTILYLWNLGPLMTALFLLPFSTSFYSDEKQLRALYSTFRCVLRKINGLDVLNNELGEAHSQTIN